MLSTVGSLTSFQKHKLKTVLIILGSLHAEYTQQQQQDKRLISMETYSTGGVIEKGILENSAWAVFVLGKPP